jgi:hypothetical protein
MRPRGHLPINLPTIAWLHPLRVARSVPRHRTRVGAARTLCTVGRPHPTLWAVPSQAMSHHRWATQDARTVHMGQPRGFWPVDSFLIEILFYFIPNSFQIQT